MQESTFNDLPEKDQKWISDLFDVKTRTIEELREEGVEKLLVFERRRRALAPQTKKGK